MRILFAGTPSLAVPSLNLLAENELVCAVLTNPDRPAGRGKRMTPSPVKSAALELGLEILQPEIQDELFYSRVKELNADLLVVIAFGTIFKKDFIDLFPMGGINVHPSKLPLYRGASPITEALLKGDTETAISVQALSMKMDQGDIYAQVPMDIDPRETVTSLTEKVAESAPEILLDVVNNINNRTAQPVAQDHASATYCSLIKKEDGIINWNESADQIDRRVRALNPWPKTVTSFNNERLFILEGSPFSSPVKEPSDENTPGKVVGVDKKAGILIQTGKGLYAVSRLQKVSRKPADFKSFINGQPDFNGSQLGEIE